MSEAISPLKLRKNLSSSPGFGTGSHHKGAKPVATGSGRTQRWRDSKTNHNWPYHQWLWFKFVKLLILAFYKKPTKMSQLCARQTFWSNTYLGVSQFIGDTQNQWFITTIYTWLILDDLGVITPILRNHHWAIMYSFWNMIKHRLPSFSIADDDWTMNQP